MRVSDVKTYRIGGKTYEQRPLVLGQLRQLLAVLGDVALPADAGALGLVAALGEKLPLALAVVLTEKGQSPAGKDLPAAAAEIEFAISPETALEVVEDFFDCNPIASLLDRAAQMIGKLQTRVVPPPSTGSLSSSPAATSAKETASSGPSGSTR